MTDIDVESVHDNDDANSDLFILEHQPVKKEIELCEDDVLKQICYQILDRIEFEHVPTHERDALCRILLNRGLMDLQEGRVTSGESSFSD